VSAALRTLLVLSLLVPAGCSRGPSNWRQWIDQATLEFKADRPAKAYEACDNAWKEAVKEKDSKQAIAAYECLYEAAVRLGQIERTFPAIRKILAEYDGTMNDLGSGIRHRNNFGVALVRAGEKQEGVAQLEAALDAYEGSAYHTSNNFRQRTLLIENLARGARVFADEAPAIKVSSVMLEEIQVYVEGQRYRNDVSTTLGAGDALAAIADLVRLRGDPKAADELLAQAREQQSLETNYLSGQSRGIPCDHIIIRSLVIRGCYAVLK